MPITYSSLVLEVLCDWSIKQRGYLKLRHIQMINPHASWPQVVLNLSRKLTPSLLPISSTPMSVATLTQSFEQFSLPRQRTFDVVNCKVGQHIHLEAGTHSVRPLLMQFSQLFMFYYVLEIQMDVILPRSLSKNTNHDAMLLLLHIKYELLEFVDRMLADSTETGDMDAATVLSNEFLAKEYQRAQLEVKLYGDALVKEKWLREVSS